MISIFGSSLIFLAFIFSIIGLGLLLYSRFMLNKDYRFIQSGVNAILGSIELTTTEIQLADLNIDGNINILDIVLIVNLVLGLGDE